MHLKIRSALRPALTCLLAALAVALLAAPAPAADKADPGPVGCMPDGWCVPPISTTGPDASTRDGSIGWDGQPLDPEPTPDALKSHGFSCGWGSHPDTPSGLPVGVYYCWIPDGLATPRRVYACSGRLWLTCKPGTTPPIVVIVRPPAEDG